MCDPLYRAKNVEKKTHKRVSYVLLVQVRVLPHHVRTVVHQVANKRNPNKVSIMVGIDWEFGFAFRTKIYCGNRSPLSLKYDLLIVHVTRVKDVVQLNPKKILRNGIKQLHTVSYIDVLVSKCIVVKTAILSVSTHLQSSRGGSI